MSDQAFVATESVVRPRSLKFRLPTMINNIFAVAEREMRSYFVSPVAWVVTAFFIAMWGFLFAGIVAAGRTAELRPLLQNVSVTLLLASPLLTMRLIAEEARSGTLELLLTWPIREVELVLGKYIAAVIFLAFMLLITVYFPIILLVFGNPDKGPILAGYLGVVLQGMAFLAIGLIASALTQNQIVAAVISFVTLLCLWLSDVLANTVVSGPAGDVFKYISITQRFQDMPRGVIDTKDVVFFLSIILGCLFISTQVITARRWR
ncbi:MAG TPA: ABC transporter permease subunit [Chloroflexota bacterium]